MFELAGTNIHQSTYTQQTTHVTYREPGIDLTLNQLSQPYQWVLCPPWIIRVQ